jgi:LacI family repressor for deo operon, udp, cdd, tsx, nupC, and nupG
LATIEDVAKMTGLSPATVSRALNNHPYVSEEKKRIVLEAAAKLNYHPNASAKKLREQKADTIAVMIPWLTNPFFAYLLEGIDTVATENDLQLLVCQTRNDPQKELGFFTLLQTKQVDGMILTSVENSWDTLCNYVEYGPIVMCNEYDKRAELPAVFTDQTYGGYVGTRHLIERGHTNIAFCRGRADSNLVSEREQGFRKAMEEENIPIREAWMLNDVMDLEDGKRAVRKLLNMRHMPTAVFTGSDQVAAGMILEARAHGLRVPEDIAVIGFDDQPIAEVTEPALTTIKQPIKEMGKKAMELMLDAVLHKKKWGKVGIELPLDLIVRRST